MIWTWATQPQPWVFPPAPWTWPTVITAVISVVALGLSIATFVQRSRYHPQPKIIITWDDKIEQSDGIWYVRAWVTNVGDAPARDLHVRVSTAHDRNTDWLVRNVLANDTDKFDIITPVVNNVSMEQLLYFTLTFHGQPSEYKPIRPKITIRWRQAPFKGRMRKMTSRMPTSTALDAVVKLIPQKTPLD